MPMPGTFRAVQDIAPAANHGLYKAKKAAHLIAFIDEKKKNYYQVPRSGYMIVRI